MNSGKGGVGIPVNVGGSSNVNSRIQGEAFNTPQKVNNNNNNVNTNNNHVITPTMTNNQNISNDSPKNVHMTNNIQNNKNNITMNTINNTNNVNANTTMNKTLSPPEIQQRQKLLLQQRALQQQQAMQNFENQFFQLLMTLNKKPKRIYNFVEETDLILQKYEQYRPSFEFHIYEDKFRICAPSNSRFQQQQQADNNQTNSVNVNNKNNNINQRTKVAHHDGLILEKDNETLKEFLEYVARGRIPEAIMEVLRDSNIQFYESNLILQVYDHTNTVEVAITRPMNKDSINNSLPNKAQGSNSNTQGQNQQTSNEQIRKFRRPRVYRTLLRPNDLTNYYDMMTYADQARFSDSVYQQFESEILTLTKRNIKLDVDLNPFEHREKIDQDEFCVPRFNEETKTMEFVHRKESTEDGTKGKVGHIPEHEEVSQSISNYEQLMLIMSERTSTTTKSTLATSLIDASKKLNSNNTNNNNSGLENSRHSSISLNSISGSSSGGFKSPELDTIASNTNLTNIKTAAVSTKTKSAATSTGEKSHNENTRFSRLKFIEQWKINVEKRKQQMVLNNNNNANGLPDSLVPGTPFMTKISMTVPMTPQAQLLQQQEQFQKFQQQQQQQQPTQTKEKKNSGKGIKRGTNNTNEKPKAKRTKKTKKDTDGTQQTPKRKRVSKKKQAAADSSNSITAASPTSQPVSNMGTPI